MTQLVMEEVINKEVTGHYVLNKESFTEISPRSPLSTHTPDSGSIDLAMEGNAVDTSIEQLYHNVCEMASSDYSPSRLSYLSYGEESRIDSELRYFAGGGYFGQEVETENKESGDYEEDNKGSKDDEKFEKINDSSQSPLPSIQTKKALSKKPTLRRNSFQGVPRVAKLASSKKLRTIGSMKNERNSPLAGGAKTQNGILDPSTEAAYVGPYLLKQARHMISLGENLKKTLDLALRAKTMFENSAKKNSDLEYVMCLHVVAALYCRLGQYEDAIPVLERSIDLPVIDLGQNHALAKFAGCMQLGDTYAMTGQIENSIRFYKAGLEIQRQVLGENDPRFGETCRYVAEAHVQAMQFDEAEKLCQMALEIHREKDLPTSSPEEAADRRLLGLIFDSKGDHEAALEHYVLASMALAANGQDSDVASIDCNIGDAYLSLARYDEAICAYVKALTVFKSNKGENHPSVASILVRLADLHNKIGKYSECRSYCENALKIYNKPIPGCSPDDIASGLVDISAIYESISEPDQALRLLMKAMKVYGNAQGQQSTIAGIEAQIGVLYYILGSYSESYDYLNNAISKFRAIGEKKSALFGVALNQMGLACVQLYSINEATDLFEEARNILEAEYGPYHADTLGVYSNLAGTYDAMGRIDDAIEILEYVVGLREETLGTANPDVDDEKRRLEELLKEAGRVRNRKSRSLETLLHTNSTSPVNHEITVL